MTDPGRRLTSWKAIAAYLGREVRTVTRWEKERALPVHRGPGGRSGVVFAEMDELDAWTRGDKAPPESVAPETASIGSAPRGATGRWIVAAAATAILGITVGAGVWAARVSRANDRPGSAVVTVDAVIARNADGSEKWRYEFTSERAVPIAYGGRQAYEPLGAEGVLVATANLVRRDMLVPHSGQLMWFDPVGRIRQLFSFEDHLQIGLRSYSAPWSISDYQLNQHQGNTRIAVAAHHFQWWPSIVTVLDDQWRRKGLFVHAGWVEYLRWLPNDRLAMAGFSNSRDGGMVALLNVNAINGQSPAPRNSEFDCGACGPDRPLRYIVMPRSEVNRVSGAPFNRASVHDHSDRLLVHTVELPHHEASATGVYEFTPQLELIHASYSDRYWDAHRNLERLGKISHTREHCPERDGPPAIEIWEPATAWRVQLVQRQGVPIPPAQPSSGAIARATASPRPGR